MLKGLRGSSLDLPGEQPGGRLHGASAVDVFLGRCLVLVDEVLGRILTEPSGHLGELFPQTVDRLLIHVGLGEELRQAH